ncbi:dihydrolipoyl dehydrogenase [Mycoplasmatota bacterium WC30]
MENINTDLLIIGAGPGGYVAAIYAAKKGLNVTLVNGKRIGGTCLNEGCIPTKALVRSAELYQEILHSEKQGILLENPSFDMSKIIDNKDEVKDKLVKGIEYLLEKYNVNIIKGYASFENDKLVKVVGEEECLINAKDIIIATGAMTKHLPIPGIDLNFVIDSEVLLKNKNLPETLNIIGGGIIGMEFAFIYASFGVKVNVIEFLPRVLPGVDREFSMRLMRYAKQLNITILNNAAVTKIESSEGKALVHFTQKGKEKSLTSELVLEAVGRVPNMNGLGLDNTTLIHDVRTGITVDNHMKTNLDNIYAIGDVTNIMQLAHVASHQGIVAVDNILGEAKTMDYDCIPAVIFTSPQIATVGKTEEMCKTKEIDYDVIKVPYSANGRALIMEAEAGYIKLLRDKSSKKLIGGMVFGKDADNLIASITIAIKNGLSAKDLQETIFAHPTVQELIHEGAMGLDSLAIHFVD